MGETFVFNQAFRAKKNGKISAELINYGCLTVILTLVP